MAKRESLLVLVGKSVLAFTLTIALVGSVTPVKADEQSPQTMKNLNAALTGERNAHARYLEFAKKADAEGYGAVASLFRAAAAAEEIHGTNHERAIRKLGGSPDVKMDTPVAGSTRDNLEAAIAGETHERKTMYPDFVHQARLDRSVAAIVTFEQAMRTEEEHAKLFEEALRDLDKLKGSSARTYYVCSICGFTTTDLNFEKCLNCLKPKDRYKAVS